LTSYHKKYNTENKFLGYASKISKVVNYLFAVITFIKIYWIFGLFFLFEFYLEGFVDEANAPGWSDAGVFELRRDQLPEVRVKLALVVAVTTLHSEIPADEIVKDFQILGPICVGLNFKSLKLAPGEINLQF
jgi:hypothetical protein